jgi:hypothetical protein
MGAGFPTATFSLRNNTPPVANNKSVTTNEDTAQSVTLMGSDADGDSLTFTVTNNPSHGTLSGTAPNLTYMPAANYSGPDSFDFKVNDGQVDSSTATVSITVNPVNDPPANIMLSNSGVADNSPASTTVGTFSTTDVDSSNFTYTLVSGDGGVDNSSFTIAGNVLKTAALFDFETKSAFYIRVRSSDEGGLFFEKQFIITVTDGTDNPGALSFSSSNYSVGEGDGSATIRVKRTGGTDNPVSVKVVPGAAGDTASMADYSFSPGGLDTTLATAGTGLENVPQAIVVQPDGN